MKIEPDRVVDSASTRLKLPWKMTAVTSALPKVTLRESRMSRMCSGRMARVTCAPSSAVAMMGREPKAVFTEIALSMTLVTSPGMSVLSPMKVAEKRVAGWA